MDLWAASALWAGEVELDSIDVRDFGGTREHLQVVGELQALQP